MIKSRIIVTGATGKTGSVVVAELLKVSYPVRTMVRREDGRSAQLKEKGRLMKLFKIVAPPRAIADPQGRERILAAARSFYLEAFAPEKAG